MVKTNSKIKYRRILLINSLVIILPGIFLGVLAYRGIQGNVVAAEKIRENRLARKSVYFTGSIEESIDTCLDAFSRGKIIWDRQFISLNPESRASQLVKEGVVLAAAGWEPDSLIKLLDQTSLFVLDVFWGRVGTGSLALDELILGNELEIEDSNPDRALIKYRLLDQNTEDPTLRIQALSGQARIKREELNQ